MKKKILVIVMAAVMILVALTACGTKEDLLFGKELLKLNKQSDIFAELSKGSADIGVMDSIMARYSTVTGTYKDSMKVLENIDLAEEEYGIAAKKENKALISKVNEALIALSEEETGEFKSVKEIAAGFGLEHDVLVTGEKTDPFKTEADASWTNLGNKVIIGYTVFAPIAYLDGNRLTGFDIELAREVFAYLNDAYDTSIQVEFKEIVWANMLNDLNTGTIDLVWNGMTITETRKTNMAVGIAYLANKQACVVRAGDYEKYIADTLEAFYVKAANATVAVENGSAAHECMDRNWK